MDGMLYWESKLSTILTFQYIMAALFGLLRHMGVGTRADHFSPPQETLKNYFTKE